VSFETTSTTAEFRISSGDNIPNWIPMILLAELIFFVGYILLWGFLYLFYDKGNQGSLLIPPFKETHGKGNPWFPFDPSF
jgi:hypothetical protein